MQVSTDDWDRSRAWLGDLQQRVYERLGKQPRLAEDQDEAGLRRLLQSGHMSQVLERLSIDADQYVELVTASRRAVIDDLPTRLQDLDAFTIIRSLAASIEEVLDAGEYRDAARPLIGTLPSGRVNGLAGAVPGSRHRVILLEDGLFGFANLMCKALAMAFPATMPEGEETKISFSSDPGHVRTRIAGNQEIGFRFTDAIVGYVVHGNPHAARPYAAPREVMQLSDMIRVSMETFVMGHEYGHLVAGHLEGGAKRMAAVGEEDMEMIATNWRQEFEADAIGLQLTAAVRARDGFDLATSLSGAYAFFSCIEVVEKSVATLQSGKEQEAQSRTHPPTPLRREALEEVVRRSVPDESYQSVLGLSQAIKQAVDSLWEVSAPVLADLHRQGWRPARSWI